MAYSKPERKKHSGPTKASKDKKKASVRASKKREHDRRMSKWRKNNPKIWNSEFGEMSEYAESYLLKKELKID